MTRRLFRSLGVILLALLSTAMMADAQDNPNLEEGLKPYGDFHGGNIDAVNLGTGGLTVTIPLWSFPQRGGLQLPVTLRYNSKLWSNSALCGAVLCGPHWNYNAAGAMAPSMSNVAVAGCASTQGQQPGINQYGLPLGCVATSPDGSQHLTGQLVDQTLSYAFETIDNSAISVNVVGMVQDPLTNQYYFLPQATDRNGNHWLDTWADGAFSADVDGNYIKQYGYNTSDTRGTAIPYLFGTSTSDYSACSGTQTITSAYTWAVSGPSGTTSTFTFCYIKLALTTSFPTPSGGTIAQYPNNSLPSTVSVLQSVALPTGESWVFAYDSYGDITQITFPTGATLSYQYATYPLCAKYATAALINIGGTPESRFVTSRTLDSKDGSGPHKWTYKWGAETVTSGLASFQATVTDPGLNDSVHTETGLSGTCSYYETEEQDYAGAASSNVLLKSTVTQFDSTTDPAANIDWATAGILDAVAVVPRVVTTTLSNGLVTKTERDYDPGPPYYVVHLDASIGGPYPSTNGNVTAERNYDFGVGSPGALLRQTLTTYQADVDSSYTGIFQRPDLVHSITVQDGATPPNQLSYTLNGYDETALASSGITTYRWATDLWQTELTPSNLYPLPAKRGHLTSVTKNVNSTGSTIKSSTAYYDTGMVSSTTDGNNHTTAYTYSSTYQGAFRTGTQKPTTANGVAHTISGTYDSPTGLIASFTDENSNTSSYIYDNLSRMVSATLPLQNGLHGLIQFHYPDLMTVERTQELNASTSEDMFVHYDGVGREVRRITANGNPTNPWEVTDTCYEVRGLKAFKSLPYLGSGSSSDALSAAAVCSGNGEKFAYDALQRKITETHSDNTYQQWQYDQPAPSALIYTGHPDFTLYKDEVGNQWLRGNNSLSWLMTALEPNGATTSPSLETDYLYDGLGNLKSVTQNGVVGTETARTRSFIHDELSRLTSATNPENGQTTFKYDANGNLIEKDSPAVNVTSGSQTVAYCFDALNRMTMKLNAAATACAAPTTSQILSAFSYDASSITGSSNTIGKLTDEKAYSSSGTVVAERSPYAYDAMGRVLAEQQCTLANCSGTHYTPSYSYDLAGNVVTAAAGLPSTVVGAPATNLAFTYGYDIANRLTTVTSSLPDSVDRPAKLFDASATSPASYSPLGLTNAHYGVDSSGDAPTVTLLRAYDNRGRVLSESDTGWAGQLTPATGSLGSILIAGSEKSTVVGASPAISSTGAVTITGAEVPRYINCHGAKTTCDTVYNSGSVSITVNGHTDSSTYYQGVTSASMAAALAAAINADSASVVTASASANVVTLSAKVGGTAGNADTLAASSNYSSSYFTAPSFSAAVSGVNLTGGANAVAGTTVYDAGTVTATINSVAASYAWGNGSTSATIASGLAAAITAKDSSFLAASASGSVVSLTSTGTGTGTNWPVTTAVSYDTAHFSSASFSAAGTGMSGGAAPTHEPQVVYSFAVPSSGGYDGANNVLSVTDSVLGSWKYAYDSLDRLIKGTPSSGSYLGQYGCWSYDSFGNRLAQSFQTTACATPESSVPATASYYPNNQVKWLSGVAATGFPYDGAGNVLSDIAHSFLYDVEGRICAVKNTTTGAMTGYVYDANGTRVAKGTISTWSCNLATNGFLITTSYVLGPGSEQVSELSVSGATSTWVHTNIFAAGKLLATYRGTNTYFALDDWLGTKRAEITPSGVLDTFFSLPYGDGAGSSTGATEQFFTGKERDSETGNDYFGARYYASTVGRFMSPDQVFADQTPYNPQSWNLYTYTRDNPIRSTDPDGHGIEEQIAQAATWWITNGVIRDGGFAPFAKNTVIGAAKGAGTWVLGMLRPVAAAQQLSQGDYISAKYTMTAPDPKILRPSNKTQAQVSTATQVTLTVASVVIPFVGEEAAGVELADDAARGLSRMPAIISSETNSAGGTVITASGGAVGSDFAPSIDAALRQGETQVNVISGVHGFADGSTTSELKFLNEDLTRYADVPEVTVYDFNDLTDSQITDMVNGPNTTVGAFCNSCYVLPTPQ